jgi:hypothetical protein
MSLWSCGIVVASMSMPATRVEDAFPGRVVVGANPETTSGSETKVARIGKARDAIFFTSTECPNNRGSRRLSCFT